MGETPIQYVDRSVNPVRAQNRKTGRVGHWCEKVSPGCKHCYSSAWQVFRGQGHPFEIPHRDKVEAYFDPRAMDEVLRRKKPTRWFWCDMTDFWGAWVKDEWIDQMFAVMALTPQHTHLWPTKRPERMLAYLTTDSGKTGRPHWIRDAIYAWHDAQEPTGYRLSNSLRKHPLAVAAELNDRLTSPRWPLPNVHLGVSVENQATADERIPLLLQTPAARRWVSYEPALGPVDFSHDTEIGPMTWLHRYQLGSELAERLDWVVIGGESGPGARPFDLAWARSALRQCAAAGVAAFMKQMGSNPFDGGVDCGPMNEHFGARGITLRDRKGGDPAEWPEDLRVREFPK
jgi:protein gp37